RHYVHLRLKTLRRLLVEQGFAIRSVSHFALEQNPFGWIQSLLNRLGIPRNWLYDALKHASARDASHPVRKRPLAAAATLLALPLVVPRSPVLSLLELVLRGGGTGEVYATKATETDPEQGPRG